MPFKPTARGECDCCNYRDVDLTDHKIAPMDRGDNPATIRLCRVCYGSMVGTWFIHRDVNDPTQVLLGRLIAWGINYLKESPPTRPGDTMKIRIEAGDFNLTEDGTAVEIEVEPGDIIPIALIARGEKKLSEAQVRVVVEPANQLCLLQVTAKLRCDNQPCGHPATP